MDAYNEQKEYLLRYRDIKKERIVRVIGEKCAICGYNKCLDALELHHIDPSQKDFTISANVNLSWEKTAIELRKCILLCANCHRELHAGVIKMTLQSSFIESVCEEITQEIQATKTKVVGRCCDCGCQVNVGANRCLECSLKHRRRVPDRPTHDELALLVAEFGFYGVGKKFNVSDNAVRKWCKSDGLPTHKAEICEYAKTIKKEL